MKTFNRILCSVFSFSIFSVTMLPANAVIPGAVVAWGAGETNTGVEPQFGQSIVPAGLSDVTTAISAGKYHTVALKNDGSVTAWGDNTYRQVTTSVTASATGTAGYNTISIGAANSAIFAGMSVTGVGIGNGAIIQSVVTTTMTLSVPNMSAVTAANPLTFSIVGVKALAAGGLHTLALKNDGTVMAWGAGKITVASTMNRGQSIIPLGLTTLTVNTSVTANPTGLINTVTLPASNTGIVAGMSVTGPAFTVGTGAKVVSITTTAPWTVTLSVPNANTVMTSAPLTFSTGVVAIAAGYYFSLAVKGDGSVVGWGDNSLGQTTIPTGLAPVTLAATVPANPAGTVNTVTLTAANAAIVPGMLVTGPAGTVGPGARILTKSADVPPVLTLSVPNAVSTVAATPTLTFSPGVVALAAGDEHCMALKSDGTVTAWGRSVEGQTTIPAGLTGVTAIAAGGVTSYALKSDGTVVAWGGNTNGQVAVPAGLSGVTAIAAGGHHAVAFDSQSPPIITTQPASVTVNQGSSATFTVTATGTLPLSYQWRKNDTILADGGKVSGATTTTLTLGNVQLADASNYSVIVTNAYGSVTSAAATLSFIASPLAVAVDSPGLAWTTGGNVPWFAQTTTTHDGVDAARSGVIADSQESWLQTTVIGSGTLSFWWKVSSEDTWDFLEFYLDDVLQSDPITGETDWQQCTLLIPAGSHTVKWRYVKDDSSSGGQDAGWVDAVNFVSDIPYPQIATEPANCINVAGTTATFTVAATGTLPLSYQWRKNETIMSDGGNISGATTATLSMGNVQLVDVGSYTVVVTNAYGSAISSAAHLTLAAPLVTTGAASGITTTTATLNGTVNPNGLATSARFEYGPGTAYGSKVYVTLSPDNGLGVQNASVGLSGLQPGQIYHYRLTASSASGTSHGGDMIFTTSGDNTYLSDLTVSGGALSPAFSSSVTNYAISVSNATSSTTVTPTLANSMSTVKVNGETVTSGTASMPIFLAPGPNNITVTVTAQDGLTQKTYTLAVTRFLPESEIQVELTGIDIADGGTNDFGYSSSGRSSSLTFTIKNIGNSDLTGLGITIDGLDAAMFTVTSPPVAPVVGPLGSSGFTVRFHAATAGVKTAALHLGSNDSDENPFDINLTGLGLSLTADTDGDGLNDAAEFQMEALGFNWQVSQPGLVDVYFDNAEAGGLGTGQGLHVDTPILTKNPASGLFKLKIGIQKSTDLLNFMPFPMTAPSTSISGDGKLEFEFESPDNAAFYRLLAE